MHLQRHESSIVIVLVNVDKANIARNGVLPSLELHAGSLSPTLPLNDVWGNRDGRLGETLRYFKAEDRASGNYRSRLPR
jgi:hypothetical protein